MALYAFHLCDRGGLSTGIETRDLPFDSAAFPVAGEFLTAHPSADHVAVWRDERPVLSRYREPPVLRPLADAQTGAPATA